MFRNIQKLNKKGKLEWEYLAAIALVLIIVVVMLLFSESIKAKIVEKGKEFFSNLLPDWFGQ